MLCVDDLKCIGQMIDTVKHISDDKKQHSREERRFKLKISNSITTISSKTRRNQKLELNVINKITAINKIAVPIILYSYGIIDWKQDKIE